MFLTYLMSGAEIGGYYLIAIPEWFLLLGVLGTLALAGGAMYLANAPQPKPSPGLWALSGVDQEVKARGRHR